MNLDDEIYITRARIDEEMLAKLSYSHVLDRMKKDNIAAKIKQAEMEVSLKSK